MITSSSGPTTGKNSGTRSIGDSTHKAANPTATLARRGTRESHHSRLAVVTQAGKTDARSLAAPGGRRRTRTTIAVHDRASRPAPTTSTRRRVPTAPACLGRRTSKMSKVMAMANSTSLKAFRRLVSLRANPYLSSQRQRSRLKGSPGAFSVMPTGTELVAHELAMEVAS